MAVVNPDHLLEQASRLILPPQAGPPRQVDIRRAISAAYYAVFHHLLTEAADHVLGVTKRGTATYALVYRSVDHGALRNICLEIRKSTPAPRYRRYLANAILSRDIQILAASLPELQDWRHIADYDPGVRVRTADAKLAIALARTAIDRFRVADREQRALFLTLLLFPPR